MRSWGLSMAKFSMSILCRGVTLVLVAGWHAALAEPNTSAVKDEKESRTADAEAAEAASSRAVDDARLEEITVTARKREENPQAIPVSITALSGAELVQQSVTTVVDLQTLVPSLTIHPHYSDPQGLVFTMRGRQQSDVTLAVDQSVGTYFDGVYYPRSIGMGGAFLDLSRVELLRGPQGTLYGRNTTGGAINILTNDPTTDTYSGSVDLTAGNYGAWNAAGILNLPITDNLAARFVAQRGAHDGYGHNAVGDPLFAEDNQYFRAKVRWTSDTVTAVLSGHYESLKDSGGIFKIIGLVPAGGLPEGGLAALETAGERGIAVPQAVTYLKSVVASSHSDFYDNAATTRTSDDAKRWDGALTLTADLPGDLQVKSITSIQGLTRDDRFNFGVGAQLVAVQEIADDKYYSEEFQITGSIPTLKWIGGIYGGYEKGNDDDFQSPLPVLTHNNYQVRQAGILNTSVAAFAQATWEFLPAWHLTTGARESWDYRRADVSVTDSSACVVPATGVESTNLGPAQCPRRLQGSFNKPSWLVSLDHQLTDQILVYGKATTGYRSGGVNTSGNTEAESFANFAPETNLEFEAGMKSELFDNRARFNLAVFHDKYSNMQVTSAALAADNNVITAVTNAASATIEGVEVDASVQITPQWRVKGSGAFIDAHYDRFLDASGDRSHEPIPAPKWTWNLNNRFVQPTKVGDLAIELDYDWTGATVLAPTAPDLSLATQRAYGLLTARANLTIAAWGVDVAIFGKNITSQKYYSNMLFISSAFGVYGGVAGAPATFGTEIIKKF